jgi:endosialidase-like protein
MVRSQNGKNMTTPHIKSIGRSPARLGLLLTPLALAWFALSPTTQAQLPPPAPDGGYPGNNTAEGNGALSSVQINTINGTGIDNTAIGFDALNSNTDGSLNTATGRRALLTTTTGQQNVAVGAAALKLNTTGSFNTACGRSTLNDNNGDGNTAVGDFVLFSNTSGMTNTGVGDVALQSNTTGHDNNALGGSALGSNTSGDWNVAVGSFATFQSTTGSFNTSLGFDAGANLTAGENNNIDIGNRGVAGESNTIRIGEPVAVLATLPPDSPFLPTLPAHTATYIAGIYSTTVAKGLVVKVDSTGHLGTVGSSERIKDAIKPMDKASEAILALKPITFRYKKEIDPEGTPQFGLLAEDVEKVNPDLVVWDAEGKVYSVRYEAVNAILLNEFLKEHSTVQELKKEIATLTATVKEQASQIQKVSAQLELSKSEPQTVLNSQ